jgi:hypothetical protein
MDRWGRLSVFSLPPNAAPVALPAFSFRIGKPINRLQTSSPRTYPNWIFFQFKTARFEFEKNDNQINLRLPKRLLEEVKARDSVLSDLRVNTRYSVST